MVPCSMNSMTDARLPAFGALGLRAKCQLPTGRLICRVAQPRPEEDGPSWQDWNDGLIEAVELYEDAEQQVRRQVQSELLQAFRDDQIVSDSTGRPVANAGRATEPPEATNDAVGPNKNLLDHPKRECDEEDMKITPNDIASARAFDEASSTSQQQDLERDSSWNHSQPSSREDVAKTQVSTTDNDSQVDRDSRNDSVPDADARLDETRAESRQNMVNHVFSQLPRPWGDDGADAPDSEAVSGAGIDNILDNYPASSLKALQSFLVEQGMTALQAETVALGLEGEGSPYANTALLSDKMDRLRRLLPGVDVCSLVRRDAGVLSTDPAEAVARLILINDKLGGPDLAELVAREPSLLYAEEVRGPLVKTLDKLKALLPPDYPWKLVQGALVEAPLLIFRMEYYLHVSSFSELPFDVQNLFMVAGGGGGTVYRAWDGFRDNNND